MRRASTYDKHPVVPVTSSSADCLSLWRDIFARFTSIDRRKKFVLCVECYPGVFVEQLRDTLRAGIEPDRVFDSARCLKDPRRVNDMVEPDLTDDPVFGRMNGLRIADFFERSRREAMAAEIAASTSGLLLVIGTGAALLTPRADCLIYADMARREIQLRQRRGEIGNFGADNATEEPNGKYKRGFFVDWRAADQLKKELLPLIDFLLDTNEPAHPKLISRDALFQGLRRAARSPFRVVPYFDPGPWGGQWMKEVCDLPREVPNYAWCFDCVPEENSLLLAFGETRVEIPAMDVVFAQPRELLGEAVHGRFGAEFPIRFDFLDTMDGGNLSLQVHPLTTYIQERFGMHYTQDESYYLLDAQPDAAVYLGLREGIRPQDMLTDLERANEGGAEFPAERYVNRWKAERHGHFSIPAGTVHCSGRNCMVLEISATPYIFTFKLWDWGRLGLDGCPRPIHLEHGANSIQWERTTEWVRENLVNPIVPLAGGEGWREERTGLDRREFIETRRHWFTRTVPHHTQGGVNVLNLVQGEEAIVESPGGAFEPLVVHYAETFIVPACVGPYSVRPYGKAEGTACATIKAFVRTNP